MTPASEVERVDGATTKKVQYGIGSAAMSVSNWNFSCSLNVNQYVQVEIYICMPLLKRKSRPSTQGNASVSE